MSNYKIPNIRNKETTHYNIFILIFPSPNVISLFYNIYYQSSPLITTFLSLKLSIPLLYTKNFITLQVYPIARPLPYVTLAGNKKSLFLSKLISEHNLPFLFPYTANLNPYHFTFNYLILSMINNS